MVITLWRWCARSFLKARSLAGVCLEPRPRKLARWPRCSLGTPPSMPLGRSLPATNLVRMERFIGVVDMAAGARLFRLPAPSRLN